MFLFGDFICPHFLDLGLPLTSFPPFRTFMHLPWDRPISINVTIPTCLPVFICRIGPGLVPLHIYNSSMASNLPSIATF